MANRAQRRKKPQPISLPMSQAKLLQGLYKNGITDKELKEEWHKGSDAGRDFAIKTCYAAVCKAAKDVCYGTPEEIFEFLQAMDYHVCNTLSSKEAIDSVLEEMGITIRFSEPFDRIELKE